MSHSLLLSPAMASLFTRRRLVALASMMALAMASGCSILPNAEPLAVYQLPATTGNSGAATGSMRSLRVVTPQSSRVIDSDRILVLPKANLVQSYGAVRWSDPAPVLLRNRLLQAFAADGHIRYLSSDDSNVRVDQELGGTLRAFQSEYDNDLPVVHIVFDAQLIDSTTRRIVAARSFEAVQRATGTQISQVVIAFGVAGDNLSSEVVAWLTGLPPTKP
ncbi:ABC-type transport auxiliary lipoprotein family protein [Herbaspirillum sp. RV1423]|uniref:ABC-type transport auxiliary lipoprotein family protein n=1 Tax=Herbaspirillum sp. RV1423 TaxID=1443993 RepID=UPI0004AD5D5E|nr:ABC-type transport auxiliary lipoprotein family protein [Herbaspirillum sp. RV1423]